MTGAHTLLTLDGMLIVLEVIIYWLLSTMYVYNVIMMQVIHDKNLQISSLL